MSRPCALTHRAVAEHLHRHGHHDPLPSGDDALARVIVRAFDRTGTRLGQIPAATSDDFDEIRFEHRLVAGAHEAAPARTVHAGAH